MAKKQSLKEYYDKKRNDWYSPESNVDIESVKAQHTANIHAMRNAQEAREVEGRPIYVVCLYGSGRHPSLSCAHESSNSQYLLNRGLDAALEEWQGRQVDYEKFHLRRFMLEPCNGCYSTTSALCNFPCTCFPGDDITTVLYPAIMKADVLLWATPVNQAMPSTRIKTVIDRLISLDGGYFQQELPIKDAAFRDKMIKASQDFPVYDARLFGKTWAYFVSSKDLKNEHEESAPYPKDASTYPQGVIGALATQATEYGGFHADPYFVVHASDPDRELSFDKSDLDNDTGSHEEAKRVVLAALGQAEKFIEDPPEMTSAGRVNRS